MLHEASPELRADGSSSLVVEQNFGQGRHSEAGASASPALSTDKIALAAAPRQLTPSIPGRIETAPAWTLLSNGN